MTTMVLRRRVDYCCRLDPYSAPTLTDGQGTKFDPRKIVVQVFLDDDRARIQVTGAAAWNPREFRTATFNVVAYEKYRPCPAWLVPIIRHLGYGGAIIDAESTAGER
jgi:hypothetical protein